MVTAEVDGGLGKTDDDAIKGSDNVKVEDRNAISYFRHDR
jgi:hypothetical protein